MTKADRRGRVRKGLRGSLALLCAFLLAMPLASCRDSDVLTEKIIGDVGQYDVDYSLAPAAVENPSAGSDISQNEDESDRQDDHDYSKSTYDRDQQNADDEVSSPQERDVDNGSGNSTVYDGTGEQKKGSTIRFDFTSNSDINDPDPNDPSNADNPILSDGPADGWTPGRGGDKTSTNDGKPGITTRNNYGNLPQTVTTVAAAGANATVVQSIGGAGALTVTNQSWLDDLPPAAYDDHSELVGVRGLSSWGDGTLMSATTFQELSNLLPHDWTAVVLVSNSYAITQDQAEAFSADSDTGRIYVIEVGAMGVADALDADIVQSVKMVGELLGASGGGDGHARERASEWNRQHTQVLEKTVQDNGGYSTWLVRGYSKNWQYQGPDSVGLRETPVPSPSPHRYYACYIDAWANARQDIVSSDEQAVDRHDGVWPVWMKPYKTDISEGTGVYVARSQGTASSYALMDYYYQHAGVVDRVMGWQYLNSDEDRNTSVDPHLFDFSQYPYGITADIGTYACWALRQRVSSDSSSLVSLGDDDWPAIIVRNKDIAQKVISSAGKLDESSRTVGQYNLGKDYDVLVMPYGMTGSWADGTFESFLMAPYFYGMYQQGGSMAYSDGYVDQFYSAFYRCPAAGILDNEDGNWGSDSRGGAACGGYGYSVEAVCKTE